MAGQNNRAAQLYQNWESKQTELEAMGGMKPDGAGLLKLKYDFLREGLYRISLNPAEQEKLHLFALETVVGKLQKQLYPNLLVRWSLRLKEALWDKPRHLRSFEAQRAENIAELTVMLKKTGMSGLTGNLENSLDYESPQQTISGIHLLADQGKLLVALQLEKERVGVYKPLDYQVVWNTADEQVRSCRIPAESGIDLSEAFNLLQGRAVYKGFENVEGKVIRQWVQLDPKASGTEKPLVTFLPGHDFDLKKQLQEVAVQLETYGLMKEQTLKQLEMGSQVAVELNGKGSFQVQANPGAKSLDLFDHNQQPVSLAVLRMQLQQPVKERSEEFKLILQKNIDQANQLFIYR